MESLRPPRNYCLSVILHPASVRHIIPSPLNELLSRPGRNAVLGEMRNGSGGPEKESGHTTEQKQRKLHNCRWGSPSLCVSSSSPISEESLPQRLDVSRMGEEGREGWEGPGIPHPITISCALMKPATRHGTGERRRDGRRGRKEGRTRC